MTIKVEVVSTENIKPSSPTPDHLRSHKLSYFDQYYPPHHIQALVYYEHDVTGGGGPADKSRCMKESLSEVLTRFYPLAGRTTDHTWVACNDDGVEYTEARVHDWTLADLLRQQPDDLLKTTIKKFVPQQPSLASWATRPLTMIQVTSFDCGGTALGCSVSHKITDGATIALFLMAWATTAAAAVYNRPPMVLVPDLTTISARFPPRPTTVPLEKFRVPTQLVDGISRRYVFSSSNVKALKAIALSEAVPNPTRVEVVSALIWKFAMLATRKQKPGGGTSGKPSILIWLVNIRPSLEPPLRETTFGNLVVPIHIHYVPPATSEDGETELLEPDLSVLVECIRRDVKGTRKDMVKKLQGSEGAEYFGKLLDDQIKKLREEDVDFYLHTSLCGFPFKELDFGYGKPTWGCQVSFVRSPNRVLLMDTKDGEGMEAHVNFSRDEEVESFESNEELISHASINPSVI